MNTVLILLQLSILTASSRGELAELVIHEELPLRMADAYRASGKSFFDLRKVELSSRLGVLVFSDDFEAGLKLCGSQLARVPMPWLSRLLLGLSHDEIVGPSHDDIGGYVEIAFSRIVRDIEFEIDDPSGTAAFFGVGLDYTVTREEDFTVLVQVGLQYAYFGEVTALDDGIGALVGIMGTFPIRNRARFIVNPQVSFGESGDFLFFGYLGALFPF